FSGSSQQNPCPPDWQLLPPNLPGCNYPTFASKQFSATCPVGRSGIQPVNRQVHKFLKTFCIQVRYVPPSPTAPSISFHIDRGIRYRLHLQIRKHAYLPPRKTILIFQYLKLYRWDYSDLQRKQFWYHSSLPMPLPPGDAPYIHRG